MNELARKRIHDDYREILSSDAGMRVLGGIFRRCRLKTALPLEDFYQGRRSVAMQIANTIYEVNPYGVADCMTAYEEFMKEYPDDERRDDGNPYRFYDDDDE